MNVICSPMHDIWRDLLLQAGALLFEEFVRKPIMVLVRLCRRYGILAWRAL
jgi:hypothetical protein